MSSLSLHRALLGLGLLLSLLRTLLEVQLGSQNVLHESCIGVGVRQGKSFLLRVCVRRSIRLLVILEIEVCLPDSLRLLGMIEWVVEANH
jgi:hypothetical protein